MPKNRASNASRRPRGRAAGFEPPSLSTTLSTVGQASWFDYFPHRPPVSLRVHEHIGADETELANFSCDLLATLGESPAPVCSSMFL